MSKSILIIDTPKYCFDCPLRDRKDYCSVSKEYKPVSDPIPEWCPLIQIRYLCNNEACLKSCTKTECDRTTDIAFAKNFEKDQDGNYTEKDNDYKDRFYEISESLEKYKERSYDLLESLEKYKERSYDLLESLEKYKEHSYDLLESLDGKDD